MFKELKVLKLLVFFCVFFLLFFGKNVNNQQQLLFFCSEYSYSSQEPISISFLAENKGLSSGAFHIEDLHGNTPVDLLIEDVMHSDNFGESVLADGYTSEKSEFIFDLKPGFYSVNEIHPLVVKNSSESSQITVVIPLMNILMYQYIKGDKAVYGKNAIISTLQNITMDENLKDARTHFKIWEDKYSVNYISDYDLEYFEEEPQPQLLIFAGNVPFWTQKMKTQYELFIENGGNTLLMTSYFQDNYAEFKSQKHQVIVRKPNQNDGYSSWNKEPNEISSIISYAYGGVPTSVSYADNNGKLISDVSIQSDLDMGIRETSSLVRFSSGLTYPIEINWLMSRKSQRKGIVNTTGVVEVNLPNNQKIVSLGSSDWLRSYNQNIHSDAAKYIMEIIDSLLE